MSTTLKLASGTELPLASAPQQVTAFADGENRTGYLIKVTASDTVTAESVNTLVSDTSKTVQWSIVTDGATTGSYSNYSILANGVTLDSGVLSFTLCKQTDLETQQAAQQTQIDALTLAMLGVK